MHGLIFGFKTKCAYSVLNSGVIDMEVKSNHVSKKRNENIRMNVDSEGGLRYTLFSNKRKKVTVHTGVYSNEKSAAHRSVGAVMKRLLIVRQRRSII